MIEFNLMKLCLKRELATFLLKKVFRPVCMQGIAEWNCIREFPYRLGPTSFLYPSHTFPGSHNFYISSLPNLPPL